VPVPCSAACLAAGGASGSAAPTPLFGRRLWW
jgi:hypothetical protein